MAISFLKGTIEPEGDVKISIKYLPGVPEKFKKKFLLQLAHFAPDEIILQGDASFAELLVDLPRLENQQFNELLEVKTCFLLMKIRNTFCNS